MRKPLSQTHPELVNQWHPTLNGQLTPQQTTYGSKQKIWWIGENCGHPYQMTPLAKTAGQNCPVCRGTQIIPGQTDLATTHPEIAAQWHPTLNGQLTPQQTTHKNSKKHYWQQLCGHTRHTTIHNMVNHPKCPTCLNQQSTPQQSLQTTHPEVATLWHPTLNGQLQPNQVVAGTNKTVWWQGQCGHQWENKIQHQTAAKTPCPYCAGRKLLTGYNDLATTHPEIAAQWHPTLNRQLTPQQILAGSHTKAWFQGQCGHQWEKEIRRALTGKCPYCTNGGKVLPGFNDLATTHPEIAAQWHPTLNRQKQPTQYRAGSNETIWWVGACGHEWENTILGRTTGSKCPICAGQKVLPGFNDLATTHPEIAAQWHPTLNGELKPTQITYGSNQKIWWICAKNHNYFMTPKDRNRSIQRGCPTCANQNYTSTPETQILNWLTTLLPTEKIKTHTRTIIAGELDIYLPEHNLAIEYNGLYWHNETNRPNKKYHYDKWLACKNKGIQLIQIWEDDYNNNPQLIHTMLTHKLGMSGERKVYARNTIVRELTQQEINNFLNQYHIQGATDGGIRVGLFEKHSPNATPVAVMLLKREPGSEGKVLNLLRYATSQSVPGGFTKLLTYVEKTYTPQKIVTFSDNCVSDGGLYKNNGFKAVKQLPPDYMYIVKNKRVHKFGYRLKRFKTDPNLQYTPGLTEHQLATLNKIPRIWDAGKTKWEKHP